LSKLGLTAKDLLTFSRAFQEGMTTSHRSHILGDKDASDPQNWEWGNAANPVDIVVLIFAANEDVVNEQLKQRDDEIAASGGVKKLTCLRAGRQPDSKEHFGYIDGVGQPVIEGTGHKESQLQRTGHATEIKAGEFILGYPNEMEVLDPVPEAEAMPEFGANGTYLVFRQIAENVPAFWNYIDQATGGTRDDSAMDLLGAKIVGRWRSGAPITKYPDGDPHKGTEHFSTENDFEYGTDDKQGFGCPIGSHIRRSNPRDSLPPDPATAKKSANRHRIMRRGRAYGDRIEDRFVEDKKARGLHFICLNSDIERQFEFVQQNWINNQTFGGLFDEVDPLVGRLRDGNLFTIQAEPIRRRVHNIPEFVTIKGGGYFFMPGIQALRYLANLK
jgi:Dyp-type peroxidase family